MTAFSDWWFKFWDPDGVPYYYRRARAHTQPRLVPAHPTRRSVALRAHPQHPPYAATAAGPWPHLYIPATAATTRALAAPVVPVVGRWAGRRAVGSVALRGCQDSKSRGPNPG